MSHTVCVICARSGSKGVPDKNIKILAGKPLLAHSIEVAVASKAFDAIAVTSDSTDYLDIANKFGAQLLVQRPENLSADTVTKLGAIEHAVSCAETTMSLDFDTIVDLDVTSPLRTTGDIHGALGLFKLNNPKSVITGCASRRSPYTNLVERDSSGHVLPSKFNDKEIGRRQESPPCFDMNASIYVWDRNVFRVDPKVFYDDTLLYEMPFERSWDIDEPIDFDFVEFLMSRQLERMTQKEDEMK